MSTKYIHASIKPPKRVQILKTQGTTYWKPGQFGYAVAYSTHPGMFTMDKGFSDGGELTYLVSKASHGRGGALWFSANALRFTGKQEPAKRAERSHATMQTLYVVTVPSTAAVGSYKTRARGPLANARKEALWDYNSARRHDGLPPVDRMPRGTKYTKEG